VTPLSFDVRHKPRIEDDANRRWVSPTEAAQLGLPAPVRKLIENLDMESR
jgi:hypothetical protein